MKRTDLKIGMPIYAHFFNDGVAEHKIKYIANNHGSGDSYFIIIENGIEKVDEIFDIKSKAKSTVNYNGGIWTEEVFIMQEMEPCRPLYLTLNSSEMPYAQYIAVQNIIEPIVGLFHQKFDGTTHEHKWQSALTSLCDSEWAAKFDQVLNRYGYYSVDCRRERYKPERENLYPLWELKCLLHDVIQGNWIMPLSMAQGISTTFWQYFNEKICIEFGKWEIGH